jgi:hypothetical protein
MFWTKDYLNLLDSDTGTVETTWIIVGTSAYVFRPVLGENVTARNIRNYGSDRSGLEATRAD